MCPSGKRRVANAADGRSAALEQARTAPPPRHALEWAVRNVGQGARLVSVEPLGGGSSHANHVIRIGDRNGGERDFVLRRWVRPDWRETDPAFTPDQEAATLRLARRGGVPAPELVACDAAAVACDVPAILMTRVPGRPLRHPRDARSFTRELAVTLETIHAVDREAARETVPAYMRYYEPVPTPPRTFPGRPALWERAIELAAGDPPIDRSCFIHRDYHQGNTLWVRGRLTAVVDWTTASFGSPLVDVAHMRANLAIAVGPATADEFLAAWRQVEPATPWDPSWDLRIAVDFIPDISSMGLSVRGAGRLEQFVARGIAMLGGTTVGDHQPFRSAPQEAKR